MTQRITIILLAVIFCCGCGEKGSGKSEWHCVEMSTNADLNGVAALASGEVWIAGAAGALFGRKDGEWKEAEMYLTEDILVLCRYGEREIWAGLGFGGLLRYNGLAWLKERQNFTAQNMNVFFVTPEGTLYVSGDYGDVLLYEDNAWVKHSRAPEALTGLGMDDEGILRASGGGWFWAYVENDWQREDSKLSDDARAFALSQKGVLWCFNWNNCFRLADNWRGSGNPVRKVIWAATFPGDDVGWAVGDGGRIMNWNGSKWKKTTSPTNQDLRGIDFISSGEGWAVGKTGTVLHYY